MKDRLWNGEMIAREFNRWRCKESTYVIGYMDKELGGSVFGNAVYLYDRYLMTADHVLPRHMPNCITIFNNSSRHRIEGERFVYRDDIVDVAIIEVPELRGNISMSIDDTAINQGDQLDHVVISPYDVLPYAFEVVCTEVLSPDKNNPKDLPVYEDQMFLRLQEGIDLSSTINKSRHGFSGSPIISMTGVVGITAFGRLRTSELFPTTGRVLKNALLMHKMEKLLKGSMTPEMWYNSLSPEIRAHVPAPIAE